ncbi:hypothetical protein LIER_11293 [Lithospermum erythrorhizon]|uniref:Uncharacterized protein n=1 Tax=Lithospermum erythrorhizon TaxID=34254 RepID=A0AAV3PMK8_LITER
MDENSSPNRYRSLEKNRIFDKYRLLDKNRPLKPRFIRQLIPSLWDTRPFLYTCPYLNEKDPAHWVLNPIKSYDDYNDPFEIQGSIAKHLIKAMNASHVMARRLDRLDEELGVSRETERTSQFRVDQAANEAEQKALVAQESASKAVDEYRASEAYHEELGEEMAYCLCHFVKTFKDINPSLATHYQEFISGYPSHCFFSLDIKAPLSPMEGEESEAQGQAQAQDPPQA